MHHTHTHTYTHTQTNTHHWFSHTNPFTTPLPYCSLKVEEDYGGTLPSTWDWAEFIKSEKEMRPRMEAWYHSGRSVQLGAAWDPAGYKPAHRAIEAKIKVCVRALQA